MPINTPQEKLMIAYLQGGNAQDIKDYQNLEQMLNTIKRVEQGSLNPKEEKGGEEED